jgi:hypothetical protein
LNARQQQRQQQNAQRKHVKVHHDSLLSKGVGVF